MNVRKGEKKQRKYTKMNWMESRKKDKLKMQY
jgi:hypothetical protein